MNLGTATVARIEPQHRGKRMSLFEAQAYCRRLAKRHYENFLVATYLVPRDLRQHFYNVYAYCRIADDLADEVGNRKLSLRLLDQWEEELDRCCSGQLAGSEHPVFIALSQTVREFEIPPEPFSDLLKAFRQDQVVTRYETFADLLGYCQFSANPVGHLVLYLCGYRDAERQRLADYTCTALQLANFWQDVAPDYRMGRVYVPHEDLCKFGVSEEELGKTKATARFRNLMKFQVERAREWFQKGTPLLKFVRPAVAADFKLFTLCGQEILNAIERQNYDVLRCRPRISRARKLRLLARVAARKVL
jgi:squalene synthase HpnC